MANTIQTQVAEQIKKISKDVETGVVDALVERELKKRTDAVLAAVDLLGQLENDLKKLRPDFGVYDAENKLVEGSEGYSKIRMEERKKAQEKIDKVTKAINKALEGDCGDVYQVVQSVKSGGGKPDATAKSEGES